MRRLFYSEIVKALACCAPDNVTDDPDCSGCPIDLDCGPAGQCWCSIELMHQARDAMAQLVHDTTMLRGQMQRLYGRQWIDAGKMEPPDDMLVWIRREPRPGQDEVVAGYVEDGVWYLENNTKNSGGAVTHWMDYITPAAPGGGSHGKA